MGFWSFESETSSFSHALLEITSLLSWTCSKNGRTQKRLYEDMRRSSSQMIAERGLGRKIEFRFRLRLITNRFEAGKVRHTVAKFIRTRTTIRTNLHIVSALAQPRDCLPASQSSFYEIQAHLGFETWIRSFWQRQALQPNQAAPARIFVLGNTLAPYNRTCHKRCICSLQFIR